MATPRPKLKRKYQVFISSTFSDLKESREQAILGIVKARHLPLALEYSGPESAAKIKVIQDAIADCQHYVIILGHRYGSVGTGQASGEKKSYIELELDYAERKQLQVLAFVMPKKTAGELRNTLQRPQDLEEIENESRYWALYRRLTEGVDDPFYRPFTAPSDIFVELYAYFSRDHDDVKGYIPEPVAEEDADILRISASNEIIKETIQTLGQFKFVDPRLNVAKDKKLALAKAFLQLHGDHVGDNWKKVFIESGSTLAYVAKELAPKLPRMGNGRADIAAYDPDAVGLISQMSKAVFGDPQHNSHSILLAAASGLQLSDQIKIEGGGGSPEGLQDCRGFHGGSYQNRLFKRCMYAAKIPAFFFMHDDKVDCPVRPEVCHFLCDSEYRWADFIEHYPSSIWIACASDTLNKVQDKIGQWLALGDWSITTYGEATATPIVMATNGAFREACERIGVTLYESRYRARDNRK